MLIDCFGLLLQVQDGTSYFDPNCDEAGPASFASLYIFVALGASFIAIGIEVAASILDLKKKAKQ